MSLRDEHHIFWKAIDAKFGINLARNAAVEALKDDLGGRGGASLCVGRLSQVARLLARIACAI